MTLRWLLLSPLAVIACGGSSTSSQLPCDDAGACPTGYSCQQGACLVSGSGGASTGGASSGGGPSGGGAPGGGGAGVGGGGGVPPSGGGSAGIGGGAGGEPSGGGTGGGSPGFDCPTYCQVIATNCTAANEQYATAKECMYVCQGWLPGSPADTSGNTLGCHLYHATAAASDPSVHCPHGGALGGGVCV